MFGMAIHMEVEYAKRFEQQGDDRNGVAAEEEEEGEKEAPSPLPQKADVSWAHILAQNQVLRCGGYSFSNPVLSLCLALGSAYNTEFFFAIHGTFLAAFEACATGICLCVSDHNVPLRLGRIGLLFSSTPIVFFR